MNGFLFAQTVIWSTTAFTLGGSFLLMFYPDRLDSRTWWRCYQNALAVTVASSFVMLFCLVGWLRT